MELRMGSGRSVKKYLASLTCYEKGMIRKEMCWRRGKRPSIREEVGEWKVTAGLLSDFRKGSCKNENTRDGIRLLSRGGKRASSSPYSMSLTLFKMIKPFKAVFLYTVVRDCEEKGLGKDCESLVGVRCGLGKSYSIHQLLERTVSHFPSSHGKVEKYSLTLVQEEMIEGTTGQKRKLCVQTSYSGQWMHDPENMFQVRAFRKFWAACPLLENQNVTLMILAKPAAERQSISYPFLTLRRWVWVWYRSWFCGSHLANS